MDTCEDEFYKVRRCKFIILQEDCPFGEKCVNAHSPDQLRPLPEAETVTAPHWQGKQVSIGIVEHTMFWDLPPPDTVCVICNRNTSLGNPFATKVWREDDPWEPPDEHGWHHPLHEALCDAFAEYLAVVVDRDRSDDLVSCVQQIALRRSLTVADTWYVQKLTRARIVWTLDSLLNLLFKGQHLRLMCHCRPHVRCHVEHIKTYLESKVSSMKVQQVISELSEPGVQCVDCMGGEWPGFKSNPEICETKNRHGSCWRVARAIDPDTMRMYCSQCWSQHARAMKDIAERALKDHPCSRLALGRCTAGENCQYKH